MTVCLLAFLCVAALGAAMGAEVQQETQRPIEAELLSRVTARSVQAGDTVFARVAADWTGQGCVLRQGATLEGTVRAALPHTSRTKESQLVLAFKRAECGGPTLQPFPMRLEAIAAPASGLTGDLMTSLPMAPVYRSRVLLAVTRQVDGPAGLTHKTERTLQWRAGEVVGLRGLQLTVGADSDGSSVLTRTGLDVLLEARTRLLFLPLGINQPPAPRSGPAAVTLNPAAQVADTPETITLPETSEDDTSACNPSDCPAAADDQPEGDPHYGGSIPLRAEGFLPRLNMELLAPNEDDALVWLGPAELLVAFNPHQLVPRHGVMNPESTVRVIRAVLLDVAHRKILRTEDWPLSDRNEYLWPLPGNRALVHVGNELRVYGSALRIEKRIELGGALAFVRVSPNGKVLAVGLERERHTLDLHQRLRTILGKDPEEDVQVLVMNGRFETIASAMSNSDKVPPVLLNEGQVRLILSPGQEAKEQKRYGLQLRTWDNGTRNLATLGSTCMPELSTLAPDLLFLVTCDSLNGARNYKVLRADGRAVLRGQSLLRELGHAASGGANAFAVRIFKADSPVLPGEPFHPADLESARLVVYRAQDGKRLFSVRVKDPAASSAGYALSPEGAVAILDQDGVDVYAMPR